MYERFTDRAQRVIVLAQEEARLLDHNYIGTEHLLLGLISEEQGVAAKTLEAMGIGRDAVIAQVLEIIGRGGVSPSGHIPNTPRIKKALELSIREALQLGHNYIGTEHILLGLIREGEGVACQLLVKFGVDLSQVREQVLLRVDKRSEPEVNPPVKRVEPAGSTTLLEAFAGDFAGFLRVLEEHLKTAQEAVRASITDKDRQIADLQERVAQLKANIAEMDAVIENLLSD